MARLWGHGAEGVCTAGCEGVNADEQHVHQKGPGVAVGQEVHSGAEDTETPQEVPAKHHFVLFQHIYNHQLCSKLLPSDFYCPTLFKAVVLGLIGHPGLLFIWIPASYHIFGDPASTFSHLPKNLHSIF